MTNNVRQCYERTGKTDLKVEDEELRAGLPAETAAGQSPTVRLQRLPLVCYDVVSTG